MFTNTLLRYLAPLVVVMLLLRRLTRTRRGPTRKTIAYSRVVDLGHVVEPAIPLWPGDPPIEFATVAETDRDGYFLRRFTMGEHSGTHLNAPRAFYPNGHSVDAYPAESLVVPSVVLDVRDKASENADYVVTVEDVLAWEQRHGRIPAGSVVLLHTGWQARWSTPGAFFNLDSNAVPHFPGFGAEVTRFLLDERNIAGLGTDTHGVDPGVDQTFATNRMVLEKPRLVLENLAHLDQLPPTGVTLVVGLLRLRHGSGAPVAVTAFVP